MTDWNAASANMGKSKDKYAFYFGNYDYADYSRSKISHKLPMSHVGWGKRAVEMRANKTHFDCFENDTLGLNDILKEYKVIEAFDKLKEDVLVCGCGFLALAGDRVMPFTAEEATGTFDWHEQNLRDGVAVFRTSTKKDYLGITAPNAYMEYSRNATIQNEEGNQTMRLNVTGRPLMGLLTYKSTTKRPFGRSVLGKPARDAIVDASRTLRQAMISAYHYNTKVDVLLGVDNDTPVDVINAQSGDVLKVGPNENGQIPQIGEFAQHAMAPFTDTILTAARNFCSDTKLSLANLGISSEAPQSPEALEIVGDDLRDDIKEWQREIGEQIKYFAMTLWMNENNVNRIDQNIAEKLNAETPVWLPIYTADVSKFGDGLTKIATNAPEIVKARTIWRKLGLTSSEIDLIVSSTQNQQ